MAQVIGRRFREQVPLLLPCWQLFCQMRAGLGAEARADQQGSAPGDLDAARLARMGGFGLLFYGPYQCAAQHCGLPCPCIWRDRLVQRICHCTEQAC